MWSRLNERLRILILVGGTLVGAAAAYTLIWTPLHDDYRNTLTRIELLQSKIGKANRQLEQMGVLDRAYQRHKARLAALEKRMFEGDRSSLVGAEIQQILSDICQKQEVSIRKSRVLKEDTLGRYHQVQVTVEMYASMSALSHILYDLFNHNYLFLVPRCEIRSVGRGSAKVRVNMTVAGLMRGTK